MDRIGRRLVHRTLRGLQEGRLILIEGEQEYSFGPGRDADARVRVLQPKFHTSMAFGGTLGAAEAYMQGFWETDDLPGLIQLLMRNQQALNRMNGGWGRLTTPAHRLIHALRRNHRRGSRRNIRAHYDLSNEFFALFLDPTMMYSCAVFPTPDSTLEEASVHKIERICRKLDLQADDHVLEIGTGWGGWAIHAARHYGCRITTTTISAAQARLARERIRDAGLADRIQVLETDYRELTGAFDKLVSIEMIEAVGHQYYDAYFRQCSALLKPHGLMALQAITIADWAYRQHVNTVDFIKRYIFPGGCLPSVTAITDAVARATDLRLVHLEDIGPHYVRTLQEWRRRFHDRLASVRTMGFPEEFVRMWEYYLGYCEAGFAQRYISDAQLLLAKPGNRRPALVPALEVRS